jgi:hypothetical protein
MNLKTCIYISRLVRIECEFCRLAGKVQLLEPSVERCGNEPKVKEDMVENLDVRKQRIGELKSNKCDEKFTDLHELMYSEHNFHSTVMRTFSLPCKKG